MGEISGIWSATSANILAYLWDYFIQQGWQNYRGHWSDIYFERPELARKIEALVKQAVEIADTVGRHNAIQELGEKGVGITKQWQGGEK